MINKVLSGLLAIALTEKMRLTVKKFCNYRCRITLGVIQNVPFSTQHFFGIPQNRNLQPSFGFSLRAKNAIVFFALSALFLIPLFAETVVLKSGQTLTGKLISRTANSITIEVFGTPKTFYFDEIESIDNNKIVSSSESSGAAEKTIKSFLPQGNFLVRKDDLYKQYIASGQSYLQAEKYNQAIEQFTKAISLEPKSAPSYYNRALTYVKLATSSRPQESAENLNQALKDCSQAIELDPNCAESYNTRSLVYYLLWKQKDDAGLLNNAWIDVHKLEELKATPDPKFIEELKQASASEKSK